MSVEHAVSLPSCKGKQKKWRKRVESGEIQDTMLFHSSFGTFGLTAVPQLDCAEKVACSEVDVKNIRDVLFTTLIQDSSNQKCRAFEWKNRGYARDIVVVLHSGTGSSAAVTPGSYSCQFQTRLARRSQFLNSLCSKVLTLPLRDCSPSELPGHTLTVATISTWTEISVLRRLQRGVQSCGNTSLLEMWKYPICRFALDMSAVGEKRSRDDLEINKVSKRARTEPDTAGTVHSAPKDEDDENDDVMRLPEAAAVMFLEWVMQYHNQQSTQVEPSVSVLTASSIPQLPFLPIDVLQSLRSRLVESFPALASQIDSNWAIQSALAIDCEMWETREYGTEVVRCACLIPRTSSDEGAPVTLLFDRYVSPASGSPLTSVVDAKTAFTGVTAPLVDVLIHTKVAWTQAQLRACILLCAHNETVLVGHALENDLAALRLMLSCSSSDVSVPVLDSALLYGHPRGFPYRRGLRELVKVFLLPWLRESGDSSVLGIPVHCSNEEEEVSLALDKGKGNPHSPAQDALWAYLLCLLWVWERERGVFGPDCDVTEKDSGDVQAVDDVDEDALRGGARLSLVHRARSINPGLRSLWLAVGGAAIGKHHATWRRLVAAESDHAEECAADAVAERVASFVNSKGEGTNPDSMRFCCIQYTGADVSFDDTISVLSSALKSRSTPGSTMLVQLQQSAEAVSAVETLQSQRRAVLFPSSSEEDAGVAATLERLRGWDADREHQLAQSLDQAHRAQCSISII